MITPADAITYVNNLKKNHITLGFVSVNGHKFPCRTRKTILRHPDNLWSFRKCNNRRFPPKTARKAEKAHIPNRIQIHLRSPIYFIIFKSDRWCFPALSDILKHKSGFFFTYKKKKKNLVSVNKLSKWRINKTALRSLLEIFGKTCVMRKFGARSGKTRMNLWNIRLAFWKSSIRSMSILRPYPVVSCRVLLHSLTPRWGAPSRSS